MENDGGRFGVDSNCYLYKATNETNFETNKTHSITVKMKDNGSPPLEVRLGLFELLVFYLYGSLLSVLVLFWQCYLSGYLLLF